MRVAKFALHFTAIFLVFVCSAYGRSSIQFVGKATALNDGRLLYIEEHTIGLDESGEYVTGHVRYIDPGGAIIAWKDLDFRSNLLVPVVSFTDKRNDQTLHLKPDADNWLVEHSDKASRHRITTNSGSVPLVADAGFDRFILKYWHTLLAGKTLKFDMLALTRGEKIRFEIAKVFESHKQIGFKIKPANWFIGLLIDPIELVYSKAEKRLFSYKGLTNIRADEESVVLEEHFTARIVYSYPEG